jgi:hypothetical protein
MQAGEVVPEAEQMEQGEKLRHRRNSPPALTGLLADLDTLGDVARAQEQGQEFH